MSIWELFVIAVGLSMDAFAVSVCKGLSAGRVRLGHALTAGIWFGGFQALMPFLGWLLGFRFQSFISSVDHWIAFRGASGRVVEVEFGAALAPKAMLPLEVDSRIVALTVGITFAFLQVDILWAITLIGVTTFVLSAIGVKAGGIVGERGKSRAELAGGLVLILMGCKILVEHLGLM